MPIKYVRQTVKAASCVRVLFLFITNHPFIREVVMKKTLLATVFLTVFAALSGHAQISFDAAISYDQPTGDFGDAYDPGFGIGGDIFYMLPSIPNLGVGGRLAWNRFGVSDEMKDAWFWEDGNESIIEILPSVRYSFTPPESQFGFFGQAGIGMYYSSCSGDIVGGGSEDDSSTDFGFCIGGGATGKFTDTLSFMIMPMYHIISTEDNSTTYFSLNFGVLFQ